MSGQVQMFPSIVQYVARQQDSNNNTRKSRFGAVRCLFGAPDNRETKQLVEDELTKQRESFFQRWDFDIENFRPVCEPITATNCSRKRNLENEENEFEYPAKRLTLSEQKLTKVYAEENTKIHRRVLQPKNNIQSHITDFWLSKKSSCEDKLTQKHKKLPLSENP